MTPLSRLIGAMPTMLAMLLLLKRPNSDRPAIDVLATTGPMTGMDWSRRH